MLTQREQELVDQTARRTASHLLKELGLLKKFISQAEAIRRIGSRARYDNLVKNGVLEEFKRGTKTKSRVDVRLSDVENYLNDDIFKPIP